MDAPEARIAPRWEWRIFDSSLASLEAAIGATARVEPQESEEIYLLNVFRPHSAKIRHRTFDLKQLVRTDSTGLELWKPVFEVPFPVAAGALRTAYSLSGHNAPDLARATYTLEEFLSEVAATNLASRAIHVRKARRKFTFRSCAAEFTQVWFAGLAEESFCIEDEDKALVLEVLSRLGLDPHDNTSFPARLECAFTSADAAPR